MKVRYWGVRGSIPVPGQGTVRIGGNTPCVSVTLSDGSLIVLDGGTGLRNLGHFLLSRPEIAAGRGRATLLFTHQHWDHIQGLPYFEPAYIPGNLFDIYAPDIAEARSPLEDNVVSSQYRSMNFPVPYERIRAAYRFHAARQDTPFEVPPARIFPVRLNHSGITLGYIIDDVVGGQRLGYLCDTAPWDDLLIGEGMDREGPAGKVGRRYREKMIAATEKADLVIHDTFFDDAGYARRKNWGHSTPGHALAVCRDASARRLHLFHYAPDLDDARVDRLEAETRAAAGTIEVKASFEGLELLLPPATL